MLKCYEKINKLESTSLYIINSKIYLHKIVDYIQNSWIPTKNVKQLTEFSIDVETKYIHSIIMLLLQKPYPSQVGLALHIIFFHSTLSAIILVFTNFCTYIFPITVHPYLFRSCFSPTSINLHTLHSSIYIAFISYHNMPIPGISSIMLLLLKFSVTGPIFMLSRIHKISKIMNIYQKPRECDTHGFIQKIFE